MPIKLIQASFALGEVSQEASARVDQNIWNKGASKLTNMLPDPRGCVTSRPGTEYVDTINMLDGNVAMINFRTNDTAQSIESLVKSITMIPGSGEFAYDTREQYKLEYADRSMGFLPLEEVSRRSINRNTESTKTDALVSLDNLLQTFPNIENISVVCSWYINSLDASIASIYPAVEYHGITRNGISYTPTTPDAWSVAGLSRSQATIIGSDNGAIRYGGTPNDASMVRYIDEIRSRGIKVTFYPFLMVDVAGKPWRGHITGSASSINTFFTKTQGYNNFILHYANLLVGRIDAFIIGSEMVGLTKVSDTSGNYPAVDNFCLLAGQVKTILGSSVKVTYAADWTEYHSYNGIYNMDKLWTNSNIDAIGIDAYFPLSNASTSIYDLQTIQNGWTSGEGYDFYYTNSTTKTNPVNYTDQKWAWKNINYWYTNTHTQSNGVTTAWTPSMKPIWFTEYGFPSVDCCTNQPNVFYAPGMVDSALPINSQGKVDNMAQYLAILGTELKWPSSSIIKRKYIWTWDARPYPAFPQSNVWADRDVWQYGHWLTGKIGRKDFFDREVKFQNYLLIITLGKVEVYFNDTKIATLTTTLMSNLTASDLFDIKFVQYDDLLLLTHEKMYPIKIYKTSHTTWFIVNFGLKNIPLFLYGLLNTSKPTTSLTLEAKTGSFVRITASSAIFTSTHINQYITYDLGGTARILAVISSTLIDVLITVEFSNTAVAASKWTLETGYEPVWSETRGYPSSCAFFQDRLWFGGSKFRPMDLWASVLSEFDDFNTGDASPADAIQATITGDGEKILNLHSAEYLMIFCQKSEYYIVQDKGTAIIPGDVRIKQTTRSGSNGLAPIVVDGATVFIDSSKQKAREFILNQIDAAQQAKDLSLLPGAILNNPIAACIKKPTFAYPVEYALFVNTDGTITVLNTSRQHEFAAWSTINIDGKVLNICAMGKDIYMITQRNINGSHQYLLEKFSENVQLDCAIIRKNYDEGTIFKNFNLFNTATMTTVQDGIKINKNTIQNNDITLETPATELIVGYDFNAIIESMQYDADVYENTTGRWSTSNSNIKSLAAVSFFLKDAQSLKIKTTQTEYRAIHLPKYNNETVFNGWTDKTFLQSTTRNDKIVILRDRPHKLQLLALTYYISVGKES